MGFHDIQNHNRIRGILRDTEAPLPVQKSKIGCPIDTDANGLISYNKLHYSNPAACRLTLDPLKTVSGVELGTHNNGIQTAPDHILTSVVFRQVT